MNGCRVADHHRVGRHVRGDNRSCAHHGVSSDRYSWQQSRTGSDAGSRHNYSPRELFRGLLASGERVIRKRNVWTDKGIVLERNPVPELHAALYGHPVADTHVILDEDMIADVAIGPDYRTGQDMGESPYGGSGASPGGFDDRVRVFVIRPCCFRPGNARRHPRILPGGGLNALHVKVAMARDHVSWPALGILKGPPDIFSYQSQTEGV